MRNHTSSCYLFCSLLMQLLMDLLIFYFFKTAVNVRIKYPIMGTKKSLNVNGIMRMLSTSLYLHSNRIGIF